MPGHTRPRVVAAEIFTSWFHASQEVGGHLNAGYRLTSASIFPFSAGQTENLINSMKPK